jgi:tRNA (cmo5U34)-methyltransferase
VTAAFDRERAERYDIQARISLPGYDALHETTADLLAVQDPSPRRVLLVGVGTGHEAVVIGQALPGAQLVGTDPSSDMIEFARRRVASSAIADRVALLAGPLDEVTTREPFDAAVAIGVLHHVEAAQRQEFVRAIRERLRPGGVLALACQCGAWDERPELVGVIERRIARAAIPAEERFNLAALARAARGRLQNPTQNDIESLMHGAGLSPPNRYFQSLLFTAWLSERI